MKKNIKCEQVTTGFNQTLLYVSYFPMKAVTETWQDDSLW